MHSAYAQNVILYDITSASDISETVSAAVSDSISVGGTDSIGGTTYVVVAVVTSEVDFFTDTTITEISALTTHTG
ncbi:hypothetical protein B0H19DRAFT_1245691 [Mycena capillaripes]|nr:hypothetical protein B0H19DRAFT_1245691 [Mycena capillaripes]